MDEQSLAHYGIKGQKWGIRRFQNADGTLTEDGRKHYGVGDPREKSSKGLTDSQKAALKKVGKAALIAGSVAAAGYLAANNKDICQIALNAIGNVGIDAVDTVKAGKDYVALLGRQAYQGAKFGVMDAPKKVGEGIAEGIANAPKAVAKAAVEGAAIIATKKFLESTIGKDNMDAYTQAYNAYNKKKKIGRIDDKKKDDDDDD